MHGEWCWRRGVTVAVVLTTLVLTGCQGNPERSVSNAPVATATSATASTSTSTTTLPPTTVVVTTTLPPTTPAPVPTLAAQVTLPPTTVRRAPTTTRAPAPKPATRGTNAPKASAPTPAPAAPAVTGNWYTDLLAALNARRAAAGVGPLRACGNLNTASAAHSADMAAMGTMTHTGSDGSVLADRLNRSGYLPGSGAWAIGENVARGYTSVPSVVSAWMASSSHRSNILNPKFVHAGLGRSGSYWTNDFGRGGSC